MNIQLNVVNRNVCFIEILKLYKPNTLYWYNRMKLFLIPNPDPPHNLMTRFPQYNDLLRPAGLSDEEVLYASIKRNREVHHIADTVPIYIVEDSELPENDYLFDAWEWKGGKVVVSMVKARPLHMARIRRARDAQLVALDVPFMRAVEGGDTGEQNRIAREKQTLRDIPATFDITTDVNTPAQLKTKWPEGLPQA